MLPQVPPEVAEVAAAVQEVEVGLANRDVVARCVAVQFLVPLPQERALDAGPVALLQSAERRSGTHWSLRLFAQKRLGSEMLWHTKHATGACSVQKSKPMQLREPANLQISKCMPRPLRRTDSHTLTPLLRCRSRIVMQTSK